MNNRKKNILETALFLVYLFLLLWIMLLDRKPGLRREMNLQLCWSYRNLLAGVPGAWKSIPQNIGNVICLIPFGWYLSRHMKYRPLPVLAVSLVFSVVVELIQYFGKLGLCELDDVICNVLGTYIGHKGAYILRDRETRDMIYRKYIKRFLDICCALAAMIVFCWLYAIVAILVRVKLGSPVLFKQERPGKDGKIFKMLKFRTMTDEKDANGNLLPDEVRLTRFGRILRATSLDELPEAINILKGDMSVIGPRPLLVKYLPLYNQHQARRHEVRPGLSGYAQVHGRNSVTWEEKFDLDVWYVDHVSFLLDVKIVIQSVLVALKHDGISSTSSVTMEEFKGSVH